MAQHARATRVQPRHTAFVFVAVALVWLLLDFASKHIVNTAQPGTVLIPDIAGLFEFRLVHNTGAAWGMFDNATFLLGIFSLVVCTVILVYVFGLRHAHTTPAETVSLALVFAGGLGNAIDRLTRGYVVDFINCTFVDFPTFNVADIGVTCGMVAFFICMFAFLRREST